MEEKYKLFGYMDAFEVYPGFVCPVFERDGKYYFQSIDIMYVDEIISFDEIGDQVCLDLIKPFDKEKDILDEVDEFYFLGGRPVFVILDDNNNVYGANYSRFAQHLRDTDFHSDDFKETVAYFLDKYEQGNKVKKIGSKKDN